MATKPTPSSDDEDVVEQEALDVVSDALTKLADATKPDEEVLKQVDAMIGKVNRATRERIMQLPSFLKLQMEAAENMKGEPGQVVQVGQFQAVKIPYQLGDVYSKWPATPYYVGREDIKVITPGGWVFPIREGIVYDTPQGTPPEEMAEGHGYQLPNVVTGILDERYNTLRGIKKETQEKEFGLGVKFIEAGWPGKDTVIGNG